MIWTQKWLQGCIIMIRIEKVRVQSPTTNSRRSRSSSIEGGICYVYPDGTASVVAADDAGLGE